MHRLITILVHFKEYVVLIAFVIASLVLLSLNDNRQVRSIRAYTVGFVGVAQDALSIIPNVFELRRENEVLRQLNVNLSDEVSRLREARLENIRLRGMLDLKERSNLQMVMCDVVGKSLHLLRNTITVNRGESDSIKVDMPIISESGLVGKVIAVSSHYAIGQLVYNKDFRSSAKIQRSRVDGILAWEGGEMLQLTNVSKTQDVVTGDIVETSEYSSVFPPDIKIGTVVNVADKPGTLFKSVEIKPSIDFTALEQVFVITALPDSERVSLEKNVAKVK